MIHGLVIIILAFFPSLTFAKRVQILHTNDLHSFFSGTRTGKGGYARLKTKLVEPRPKDLKRCILMVEILGKDPLIFSLMKG